MRKAVWKEQNRREKVAESHRNLGYQDPGKIMTELAGCWHPIPTILPGLPPWRGGGLPSSLYPCLLWPLGVGNASDNPRFTLANLEVRAFRQGAENCPTCSRKPRKPRGTAGWEWGRGFRQREAQRGKKAQICTQKPNLVTEDLQTLAQKNADHMVGEGGRERMTREEWKLPSNPRYPLPIPRSHQPLATILSLPTGKELRHNSDFSQI